MRSTTVSNTIVCGQLLQRATMLGQTHHKSINEIKLQKSVNHKNIDKDRFKELPQGVNLPSIFNEILSGNVMNITESTIPDLVNEAVEQACLVVMEKASQSHRNLVETVTWDVNQARWERILQSNNPKTIWQAINWKGGINESEESQLSDSQFKTHFEALLNPHDKNGEEGVDVSESPYVPLLDNPFTGDELKFVMKSFEKNKSYSGICPGLVSVLPETCIAFFLTLFDLVFLHACYPVSWCFNRFFVLFKSGSRVLCDNYYGISIMDMLAKIFDMLILNRLRLWYYVDKYQAGGQKGRRCLKYIFALRMLCDYAKKERVKLYVLLIDFSKAYDHISREKLLSILKEQGCG